MRQYSSEVITPLSFECEENIFYWAVDGFQNYYPKVVRANNPDIQVYGILSMILRSAEKWSPMKKSKGSIEFNFFLKG